MSESQPWYRGVKRWGQINLNEPDPLDTDIAWWVDYWRRTRVEGVVLNAGGIIAYYPTEIPLHRRSPLLGDCDLFGDLVRAARDHELAVIARMDSSKAAAELYHNHPDWFAHDADGQPYREADLYVACIHGPNFSQHILAILREVIERYRPDGFFDNSWSGLGRGRGVCYCPNCARGFREATGLDLPRAFDSSTGSRQALDDPTYRRWIEWNYDRRTAVWELNNHICREAGGPHCLWIGNTSGDLASQSASFRDWEAIGERTPMIVLDHQARSLSRPLWDNGEQGKLIRAILGDDAPVPESIALYNAGGPSFRRAAKPEPEVRLWWTEAVAGGIRPWWHHVGAVQEDRRMFRVAVQLHAWHQEHERYLFDRRPLANVGVVFSQRSVEWYGRDEHDDRCSAPHRGLAYALVRARIPYAMVPDWKLDPEQLRRYRLLILPNIGALSDERAAQLCAFVEAGGSLLATGETSLFDEWGQPRTDFVLGAVFGVRALGRSAGRAPAERGDWGYHTYLRLPDHPSERHEILRQPAGPAFSAGWDETTILPFGGRLLATEPLAAAGPHAAQPLLTFVPPFPVYPPETAWMRVPRTTLPALYAREHPGGGRVVYSPADIDRLFWLYHQPDHGDLLARAVLWVLGGELPVRVRGLGLVDVHAYVQGGEAAGMAQRTIIHLVNLTGAGTWRPPVHELTPVGTQTVWIAANGRRAVSARLLVGGQDVAITREATEAEGSVATKGAMEGDQSWISVHVPAIVDHEVVVVEWGQA